MIGSTLGKFGPTGPYTVYTGIRHYEWCIKDKRVPETGSRTDSFMRNIPGYGEDATWPTMGNGTNGTTLGIYTKTHGICQFGGLPTITWTTAISGSR